jgi:hypothetical protein
MIWWGRSWSRGETVDELEALAAEGLNSGEPVDVGARYGTRNIGGSTICYEKKVCSMGPAGEQQVPRL